MTFLHIIILGIIEGITEFIPVSSTAHLLLSSTLLGLPSSSFMGTFLVAIQSGAILAAVVYFWKTIWGNIELFPKIIVGFIPTGIAGILLYPLIKPLFSTTSVIAYALIIGGVILLFIRPLNNT